MFSHIFLYFLTTSSSKTSQICRGPETWFKPALFFVAAKGYEKNQQRAYEMNKKRKEEKKLPLSKVTI
jgi:hypothetical protein